MALSSQVQSPGGTERDQLDLEAMLKGELGASFKGVNPNGSVKVGIVGEDGQEEIQDFDLQSFMRDNQMDPSAIDIQYNTPETPVDSVDLDFGTKTKLAALGDDRKSIRKNLADEFGQENVQELADGIVVKQDGVWKRADQGFMDSLGAGLAANAPEMAVGMAGRAGGAWAGAAIGTAIAPGPGTAIGGVIGAIMGGGLGSATATVVKNKSLEAAGIKTQYDAEQATDTMKKELAWNIALDATLPVVGKGLKAVVSPLKTLRPLGAKITSTAAKIAGRNAAEVGEYLKMLVPGTESADWRTMLNDSSSGRKVVKFINQQQGWFDSMEKPGAKIVDPMTSRITSLATKAMTGAKASASRSYDTSWKQLEASGVMDRSMVPLTEVATNFKRELAELGILETAKDGTIQVSRKPKAGTDQIMQVFDGKSLRTMNQVLQQLNSVLTPVKISAAGEASAKLGKQEITRFVEKQLSFRQVRSMLKGIDDILESSGYYAGGDAALSNNARRSLVTLRKRINDSGVKALEGQKIDGQSASKIYSDAARKYSAFRSLYDDFSPQGILGGDAQRTAQTVERMLGDKGRNLEQGFDSMLKAAGVNSAPWINRMQQLRAAKNLSAYTPKSTGIFTAMRSAIGVNSPEAVARSLVSQQSDKVARLSPVRPETRDAAKGAAHGLDWLKNQGAGIGKQLATNPILLREFVNTVLGTPANTQRVTDSLLGGGQQ